MMSTPTAPRTIERIARKYAMDEQPSMVDEYAHLSNTERATLFLRLRKRVNTERYGTDQRFERVCSVARRT
ncbi:MAG: hypothetical protein ACREO8_06005 [Luteimonas sp.]